MGVRSAKKSRSAGGTGFRSMSASQNTSLSPVEARMMNSWLRSPPMGPVSARMGIAVSPRRAKMRRYDTNMRL